MKPVGVVTCIQSINLNASIRFYRDCFGLPELEIEDDMFTIELNGFSMFVMSRASFETYTSLVGLPASFPQTSVGAIFSCAIDDLEEVERILTTAEESGGSVSRSLMPNQWGQQVAYVRDPDGHVWELVLISESSS